MSPKTTTLDVTTMSFIAKPRLSRVPVSDLKPANKKLGIVNYTRDTTADNAARKWYMFPAVGNFNIQANNMQRTPWVWESIANVIARQRV
ncbi:putative paired amphipathic helix protein [Eutypa lata UCREL1]|uniref:Putative paired amphipathic helix protein n=1 Tax=Eutypa lata (strain UCR-EL1) TaxID=1287681 RepID=M7SRC7_EUTLA|nr:putative paired amphipathic helix protein [Eutypa lata UCREL1]